MDTSTNNQPAPRDTVGLYIEGEGSTDHTFNVFTAIFTATKVSMKVWSISLLLLLLLSTAAVAKKDVLVVDKDESLGRLSDKTDAFDTSIKREDEPGKAQDEMSWEAAKELLDAVEEFGNITGNVSGMFP